MNDRLIHQHFAAARQRYVYGLDADRVLVADGFMAMALPRDHVAFDSRTLYSRLPEVGEAAGASSSVARPLERMWRKEPTVANYAVRPSRLFRKVGAMSARVFLPVEESQRWAIHVQEMFVDLFGDDAAIEGLTYRTAGPHSPMIVFDGDEQIAVIMPIHVHVPPEEIDDAHFAAIYPGWADYASEEDFDG